MKSSTAKIITLFMLMAASVAVIVACAQKGSMAVKHPMEVEGMPICGDCHTDGRAALNHTMGFNIRHKLYAAQQKQVCETCHDGAFCADCHANKEELKPSDKYKDSPGRALPHRGDYLTQHRIDGRINPASCFPCHGRQNNERCRVCHK